MHASLQEEVSTESWPGYRSILLALDSSDHANHGTRMALDIAALEPDARLTGAHVYAAALHDLRFRQMEGGLPEQFRNENELERQRGIHDTLITRGLSVISDSYLDQADRACRTRNVPFTRRALEGKNYRALTQESNTGKYDLIVLGALGLGAVEGSRLGSVCNRVVRRTTIDALVIRDPQRDLASGPIVVAIDGSPRSYGGLMTGMRLSHRWQVPLHVISSFDPYFHYVAFNRIAGVLSDEASKVFRFREQEKLHEEIIDSGLARIYEGHLAVAQSIADACGISIETRLLDGKAHDAVQRYVREVDPTLLVVGKLGIHADDELDIGSTAEQLLSGVDCSMLLSQREYEPSIDLLAETTTSWTVEAEQLLSRAPSFVQSMARMAILRYAQERGHTVITARLVEEATAELMPAGAERMLGDIARQADTADVRPRGTDFRPAWSPAARASLDGAGSQASLRENVALRAEKKARAAGATRVEVHHVRPFLEQSHNAVAAPDAAPRWTAAALARLARAPQGFMRDKARSSIEAYARDSGIVEIDIDVAEAGLEQARIAMQAALAQDDAASASAGPRSKCPFAGQGAATAVAAPASAAAAAWSQAARARLAGVPEGYCRDMMVSAAEAIAAANGVTSIDPDFLENVLGIIAAASTSVGETMSWDDSARTRIERAPDFVRGMLQREIEAWATRQKLERVTADVVDAVKQQWADRGAFHLDPDDPRSRQLAGPARDV